MAYSNANSRVAHHTKTITCNLCGTVMIVPKGSTYRHNVAAMKQHIKNSHGNELRQAMMIALNRAVRYSAVILTAIMAVMACSITFEGG